MKNQGQKSKLLKKNILIFFLSPIFWIIVLCCLVLLSTTDTELAILGMFSLHPLFDKLCCSIRCNHHRGQFPCRYSHLLFIGNNRNLSHSLKTSSTSFWGKWMWECCQNTWHNSLVPKWFIPLFWRVNWLRSDYSPLSQQGSEIQLSAFILTIHTGQQSKECFNNE